MSSKIGVGDYVTTKSDGQWIRQIGFFVVEHPGPVYGKVYQVQRVSEHEDDIFLWFAEYPKDAFHIDGFRKVLPNGLAAWLDAVEMNPSKTEVKEDA